MVEPQRIGAHDSPLGLFGAENGQINTVLNLSLYEMFLLALWCYSCHKVAMKRTIGDVNIGAVC